jgi:hypothetical protein
VRNSFALRAIEEFRKLAAEFAQKADELERTNPLVAIGKRRSADRRDAQR